MHQHPIFALAIGMLLAMIRNYILIAYRNMVRDPLFSVINIAGLAIGITCFLLLFLFVQDELTFDQGTSHKPIYRVYVKMAINGVEDTNSKTAQALGPILQQNYPEVVNYTRIGYFGPRAFLHENNVFRNGSIYAVDSTFFKLFNITFIEGNPATALSEANTLVITASAARRIFGDKNPVGQLLPTESGQNFLITALIEDFPRKSHFHCDFLESLTTYPPNESWMDLWFTTYIELRPGTNATAFEDKLKTVVMDQVGPEAEKLLGVPMDQFLQAGNQYQFHLQPFSDIYLHSKELGIDPNTEWGNVTTSDATYTYMFSAVAIFILLLAVINFMNLYTAKSARRAREVGIRKTFGSDRSLLVLQFMGEAIFTSLIAMTLALVLIYGILPLYNQLLERELSLVIVNKYVTFPLLLLFVIGVGVLAGSYPAFYLSAFKPVKVLKGKAGSGSKSTLRNFLVITQFSISICLLIGTVVIKEQLRFIQNKNLGFNKEQLLTISNTNLLSTHQDTFKEALINNPKVISVTSTSRMFGNGVPGSGYLYDKKAGTDPLLCQFVVVDYDFLKTFEISLTAGRFFSKEFPSDMDAVLINAAAARTLPDENPIGKELVSLDARDKGHAYHIIGIIDDFNYESLHTQVRPLVLHLLEPSPRANTLSIRVDSDDLPHTIAFIESKWKELVPGDPIQYNFIDTTLARLYVVEQKINVASLLFSLLAIVIACIGLFGLSAYAVAQRTKEIGVRKVLGATATQVFILLSREFAIWVLIANLIAWPVAYYFMSNWLTNFAFRTDLSLFHFLLAGAITSLIAFFTVALHAMKAAQTNPVESLKHE